MMRSCTLAFVLAAAALGPAVAFAQKPAPEIEVQRGPAAELYIRKRPPTPEAPVLSAELKKILVATEKKRDAKRLEAIGLLRAFLGSNPTGEARADGLFKLAELLWEESRRLYLIRMDDYGRALEKCAQTKGECAQPKEPRIDLREAEALYPFFGGLKCEVISRTPCSRSGRIRKGEGVR